MTGVAKATVRLLSARGIGGIAVVELRGPSARNIVKQAFRPARADAASLDRGRTYYGHVVEGAQALDEVLLACVAAGGGESVFEINCHGGLVPAGRVIEALCRLGAERDGAPTSLLGETLAHLERELLEQLVHARTERAADVLLTQLAGRLREALEEILGAAAGEETSRRVEALRATCSYGRRLVEPATVVITGAPNVGKSTLANTLTGRERSIVHHLPGTTRDAVTSVASIDGLPTVVVDTAGLREAADEIERIGVTKTLERVASCDLVLWVFDHSRAITPEEAAWLDVLRELPLVPVMNKIDLEGPVAAREIGELTGEDVQRVCALTGRGVERLRECIVRALVGTHLPRRDAAVVTTRTVRDALDEAVSKHDRGPVESIVFDRGILE